MNVEKQVAHWLASAAEDWDVAEMLLKNGKLLHGLFFIHLTVEKAFKAAYCKKSGQVPPKIHNLLRLAELADITLTDEQRDICSVINKFNDQGRYPETGPGRIEKARALKYLLDAEGIYRWLIKQL